MIGFAEEFCLAQRKNIEAGIELVHVVLSFRIIGTDLVLVWSLVPLYNYYQEVPICFSLLYLYFSFL
ncbi:MAG: hypothetical protein DRI95_03020 [Bacteroidetes bacterium]|nr:MAG: hypothetical protein DRI95_03020 [Bacteroidota bacterium]